jgi:hypothetical protein
MCKENMLDKPILSGMVSAVIIPVGRNGEFRGTRRERAAGHTIVCKEADRASL